MENVSATTDRFGASLAPETKKPYLRIQSVTIFVRDQDRSIRFYVDKLEFTLAFDVVNEQGLRWVGVAPPDGSALLLVVAPKPESDEYQRIGRSKEITFVTEDVVLNFDAWSERGVRFIHPPQTPSGGVTITRLEDEDGNTLSLVSFDQITRELEQQRRLVAEKLESERRAAQELEIAKQVQARLFPQTLPLCPTLDYSGICIQARQVGGDYYDFLNLGQDRLGLVVGDIAGKGIAAALLMANLQANLRGQSAIAWSQPQRLLQSVNKLFYDNTADSSYATLFFAEYDDRTRCLRYLNCGHLCGLLFRTDTNIERLQSTGTVLGLFSVWDCEIAETQLLPGDTLVLYTDGVTEALNDAGEEFGESRLITSVQQNLIQHSQALMNSIVKDLQQFTSLEQYDDITLIVAKCLKS